MFETGRVALAASFTQPDMNPPTGPHQGLGFGHALVQQQLQSRRQAYDSVSSLIAIGATMRTNDDDEGSDPGSFGSSREEGENEDEGEDEDEDMDPFVVPSSVMAAAAAAAPMPITAVPAPSSLALSTLSSAVTAPAPASDPSVLGMAPKASLLLPAGMWPVEPTSLGLGVVQTGAADMQGLAPQRQPVPPSFGSPGMSTVPSSEASVTAMAPPPNLFPGLKPAVPGIGGGGLFGAAASGARGGFGAAPAPVVGGEPFGAARAPAVPAAVRAGRGGLGPVPASRGRGAFVGAPPAPMGIGAGFGAGQLAGGRGGFGAAQGPLRGGFGAAAAPALRGRGVGRGARGGHIFGPLPGGGVAAHTLGFKASTQGAVVPRRAPLGPVSVFTAREPRKMVAETTGRMWTPFLPTSWPFSSVYCCVLVGSWVCHS